MAKKHKLKPKPPLPHIEGDFVVIACDLSLRCPGFAKLKYIAATRSVKILDVFSLPQKTPGRKGKTYCEQIDEAAKVFSSLVTIGVSVYVRERAVASYHQETFMLQRVAGIFDLMLWRECAVEFEEIAPPRVKKNVTGYGFAPKQEVANGVANYCEPREWKTDDESDAVAVGIAWLVENGYLEIKPLEKYRDKYEAIKLKEEKAAKKKAEQREKERIWREKRKAKKEEAESDNI